MKNQTTRYHKPELDAYVTRQIREISQRILISASVFASKNEPPLECETLEAYFMEEHQSYQGIVHSVNERLQSSNLFLEATEHTKRTESEIAVLQNKLTALKEEQLVNNGNAEHAKPPYSVSRVYVAWCIIGSLSLFEGLINFPTFSAWGFGFSEASIMSLLFAVLLAIFAHAFEPIMRKGKTQLQQRIIATVLLLIVGVLFWFMAVVRAEYLSATLTADMEGVPAIQLSPIPLALLSTLLFISSVAVCHFALPSRTERDSMRECQAYGKKQRDNEAKQKQIEDEINAKRKDDAEVNSVCNSLQEYGATLERQIITQAHHGLALWKKHNMMHRTNGRPMSFNNAGYPLKFQTYFHHVNLL